jgi:peptidoglycan/LPS O-acetylase OafA/YrhL
MDRKGSRDTPRPELKALTGFRFLAAFYVFVFHVQIRWPLTEGGPVAKILDQGAVGMTMFFMLSGFVLTYTYGQKEFSVSSYLKNRIARIYPIYVFAALLFIPYLGYQLQQSTPKFLVLSILAQGSVIAVSDILMVQAWMPMLFKYLNNTASWSLSAEAFFYVMFVPIVWGLRHANLRTIWYVSGVLFVFSILPPLSYCISSAFDERPNYALQIFYCMPIFRLSEFVLGMISFLVADHLRKTFGAAVGWVALSLTTLSLVYLALIGGRVPLFTGHNWIVVPTVASSLIALSSGEGLIAYVLGSRPMAYLGKISYCFYSFQLHVLLFVGYIGNRFDLAPMERFALALGLLMAVSAAAYHFIEEPTQRFLRGRSWRAEMFSLNVRPAA